MYVLSILIAKSRFASSKADAVTTYRCTQRRLMCVADSGVDRVSGVPVQEWKVWSFTLTSLQTAFTQSRLRKKKKYFERIFDFPLVFLFQFLCFCWTIRPKKLPNIYNCITGQKLSRCSKSRLGRICKSVTCNIQYLHCKGAIWTIVFCFTHERR